MCGSSPRPARPLLLQSDADSLCWSPAVHPRTSRRHARRIAKVGPLLQRLQRRQGARQARRAVPDPASHPQCADWIDEAAGVRTGVQVRRVAPLLARCPCRSLPCFRQDSPPLLPEKDSDETSERTGTSLVSPTRSTKRSCPRNSRARPSSKTTIRSRARRSTRRLCASGSGERREERDGRGGTSSRRR